MSVENAQPHLSPPDPDFNVFAGAETGLLKGISVSSKGCIAKNFKGSAGKLLDKDEEITCMEWTKGNKEVLVGLKNRIVRVSFTLYY